MITKKLFYSTFIIISSIIFLSTIQVIRVFVIKNNSKDNEAYILVVYVLSSCIYGLLSIFIRRYTKQNPGWIFIICFLVLLSATTLNFISFNHNNWINIIGILLNSSLIIFIIYLGIKKYNTPKEGWNNGVNKTR